MANNPKHMDNLKNFPKGVSGNPKGAPKTKLLKDVLTAELQTESNGVDKLTAIINKLTTMAVKGDMNAIKEVLDRYAGKSTQHNETKHSGEMLIKQELSHFTNEELLERANAVKKINE